MIDVMRIADVIKQRTVPSAKMSDVAFSKMLLEDLALSGELDGDNTPPVATRGALYRYEPRAGTWDRIPEAAIGSLVQLYDGLPTFDGEGKMQEVNISSRKCAAVKNCALESPEIYKPEFFDEAPTGIAFANGFATVTKDGVAFEKPGPQHRALVSLPCDYSPGAEFNEWEKALSRVFLGDKDADDKKLLLQEFVGACMVGIAANYTKCLVLIGDGENGKSVIGETIKDACFPKEAVTHVTPQSWTREYNIAQLAESRLNLASELPEADIQASDVFKTVIDGGDVIARHPYERPFSFQPRAGHMFLANNLPGTVDHSHGFWRRFFVVEFNRDFGKDPERVTKAEMKRRLTAERSGICVWALMGAVRLLRAGHYTTPSSHVKAIGEWRLDVDPVAAFADACLEKRPAWSNDPTPLKEIYDSYKNWCEESGRRPTSDRGLAKRLRGLKYTPRHRKDGLCFEVDLLSRPFWATGKKDDPEQIIITSN
jgi:P4 family phage/plasmid primase-like protien